MVVVVVLEAVLLVAGRAAVLNGCDADVLWVCLCVHGFPFNPIQDREGALPQLLILKKKKNGEKEAKTIFGTFNACAG